MRTAFTLATLLALAGCAVIVVPDDGSIHYQSSWSGTSLIQGNNQSTTEPREIAGLTALDVNGPVQMEVRVGNTVSLQVEGESNLLPLVHTEASGGTLRVWVDGSFVNHGPLRVVYSTPQISQINSNGSGTLVVSGLHGGTLALSQNGSRAAQLMGSVERLDLRMNGSGGVNATGLDAANVQASLNGSGRLSLGQLRGESLSLELHGSGGVTASGSVRAVSVRTYGSGSADLAGLSTQGAELSSNGSGSITAAVTQNLVADASGSGHITVYGNPQQRSISGKRVSVVQ